MRKLLEKILEQDETEKEFEELFQPISDQEKEERIAELMKEYEAEKAAKGSYKTISDETIDALLSDLEKEGFRPKIVHEFSHYPTGLALRKLGAEIETPVTSLEVSVSVTTEVGSDLWKKLNLTTLRSIFAKHGLNVCGYYTDTYSTKKPNIRRKRIKVGVAY